MLKIRGSVIFKECATKSSVFIQSNSGRNICLLSTIWSNSRYERPRIHFHPGPQVRHARRAVHCLKSVKTGNCLRASRRSRWTALFPAGQHYYPRFPGSLGSHGFVRFAGTISDNNYRYRISFYFRDLLNLFVLYLF